jgi:CspA family cold shock protein
MEKGKIIRLTDRGFGFIARKGADKDLFFHSNELQGIKFNDLKEGDEVQFETSEGPKGLSAIKVSRL